MTRNGPECVPTEAGSAATATADWTATDAAAAGAYQHRSLETPARVLSARVPKTRDFLVPRLHRALWADGVLVLASLGPDRRESDQQPSNIVGTARFDNEDNSWPMMFRLSRRSWRSLDKTD
uniref:Uncharacterized protein n=1 Tax=Mycena chlorophos TaxID=658473 RepID=A0ABQ0KYC6_MYCCL|nr:predicted protein [Mycena chlorophos]